MRGVLLRAQSAISRRVTVAADPYAPGHLGELTQIIDPDLVDAVVAETGRVQRRLRQVPSRVVVYLVLASALFGRCGWLSVWGKLTRSLPGVAAVTASALTQARQRVGAAPLRRLFTTLAGPLAGPDTAGAFWRGLRTVIFDGTLLAVPDDARLTSWLPKRSGRQLTWGYPQLRLVMLIESGTRAVLGAAFGPERGDGCGEVAYARRLLAALRTGMLLLADAGYDTAVFAIDVEATGAQFLIRSGAARNPTIACPLRDGSYLAWLTHGANRLQVRIIEAEVSVITKDGRRRTEHWRLITSLLDPVRYPATDLARLYHERWEVETTLASIKSTMLDGRVLRSRREVLLEQELYALLTVYQALITVAVDAAASAPGLDCDRISFTVLIETARDLVIAGRGITPAGNALVGEIARAVLDRPLPPRRQRTKARCRKVRTSKYPAWSSQPTSTQTYTIDTKIAIFEQPLTARRRP